MVCVKALYHFARAHYNQQIKIMKTLILLGAAVLIGILTSAADNCRYVTVTTTNAVASIGILAGETGELVATSYGNGAYAQVIKDGLTFGAVFYSALNSASPTIIAGPATFILNCGSSPPSQAFMTVKITPSTYDVNKTLILPPGTNQVYIALQCSTDLVNWADSTNGIYGSPVTASFFRMRMGVLPAP